jgi:hypothetical protein
MTAASIDDSLIAHNDGLNISDNTFTNPHGARFGGLINNKIEDTDNNMH